MPDDDAKPKYVCQFAGCEDEATAGKFGHTYCEPHNEQVKAEKAATKPRRDRSGGGTGSLRGRIRETMLGTAAVAAIRDPRIYVAVEATVDEFAASWDNVAKQSPTARKYIEAMLNGGVWLPALMSTIVMVVTTLAVTDSLPPRFHPLGHFCIGQAGLGHLFAAAPPVAGTNNGGGPEVPVVS